MGTGALRVAAAILLLGVAAGAPRQARALADPLAAMTALRVTPPSPAPDVTFQGLDGRPARLESLQGRPVLLTFFTTW